MSKKLSKARVFTEKEFREASRLEKCYMHMIQPRLPLSERDREYLEKLKQTFVVLTGCLSRIDAAKQVIDLHAHQGMTLATANKYIRDSELLFAPMLKTNRDLSRAIVIEKARLIHDRAMETDNLKQANEALKVISKVQRLDQPDASADMLEELQLPDIVFVTNPSALKAEDIAYEETEEEE